MKIGDVETPDGLVMTRLRGIGATHVAAAGASHALVAAGAERERPLAGEDDHADGGVFTGALKGIDQLDDRLGTERVADLRPVDRDLRDPGVLAGRELVTDVLVLRSGLPGDAHAR